jgi:hypothetical protein
VKESEANNPDRSREKSRKAAGPFVKARVEYEKQEEQRQKAQEEFDKRQQELKQKHQAKVKKAVKLQMRTKRGQPIMANLMDVMLEKIERDSRK